MSRFFIDRPIFAWVVSLGILLAGFLALRALPIESGGRCVGLLSRHDVLREVARGLGGVAHTAEQCDVFDLARSVDVVAHLHALTVLLDVRAEVLTDITHEGR